MTAPPVTGPRDVPELRNWLIRQWQPGRPFSMMPYNERADPHRDDRASSQIPMWCWTALPRADLWWVSADMVDLVETSSTDLPSVELTRGLVPSPTVFAVFERPLQGVDAVTPDSPVLVDAVMWDKSMIPKRDWTGHDAAISVFMYRRINYDDGLTPGELGHAARTFADYDPTLGASRVSPGAIHANGTVDLTLHGEMWLPLGRTDWRIGDDWADPHWNDEPELAVRSMSEDRRWLATLWALSTQPNVVDLREENPTRPVRREAKRRGYSDPTVRVVSLRRSVYEGAGASREPGAGRTFHVRWPVRGHWRNQAYGPGHRYRRPTFIASYIKGPEGAPLRKGATVHVLRGPEGAQW